MARKSIKRGDYTEELRAEALRLAQQVGTSRAAQALGLPIGTVSTWRYRARHPELERKAPRAGAVVRAATGPSTDVQAAAGPAKGRESGAPFQPVRAVRRNRVAKFYTASQRAQALELVAQVGAVEASRRLGISRFSLYEWTRRHGQSVAGESVVDPLVDDGVTPKSDRDERILAEWKCHPGLGPSQIRNQLRRGGFKVSTRTVRMVMEEHGYVLPKVKRKQAHDQRYEAVRPNQLWHMDFLQRHIHKQKISVLCGDGGSAFWSWRGVSRFTRLLEEMEVEQLIAKVPEVNGKLEVLNANVQKELFNQERFFDLGEALARLRAWVAFYNMRRTHHALGGLLVPADRYFGRSDDVLAQVESGRSPEGVGEPIAVGDRQLDLLRVTSRAGKLELHLMGEKLWPQKS